MSAAGDKIYFIDRQAVALDQTASLVGHYPNIYTQKNIPIFGLYDFAILGTNIYVSFNADPKIYVLDTQGTPLYSFGCPDEDIKLDYPQTKTFDEYEDKWFEHRQKYGYYDRIYLKDNTLLRTCRTDKRKYKLQVYQNEQMTGDIELDRPMEIIGLGADNYYYAYVRDDIEEDRFVLIKFLLQ